jgi:DHA2 family methylenomycin A resistance protein-like MFS transporter
MNLVFNGLLFVSTLYLQDVRGLSPLRAGLAVLPLAVPLIALAPMSGAMTARSGPRTVVAAGCLVAAPGGLLLLGLSVRGGLGWLIAGFAVLGCGAGLVATAVVAAAVRATPADRPGLATGMSNTARQVGTATGVAAFGAVAGAPGHAGAFVHALRALAVLSCVLWLAAGLLATRFVATVDRRTD